MSASLRLVDQLSPWEQTVRTRVLAWQREKERQRAAEAEWRERLRQTLSEIALVGAALLGELAVLWRLFQ